MNFGNFTFGLGVVYGIWYTGNILYDLFFKRGPDRKEESTEEDVDISEVLQGEEYAAVEVSDGDEEMNKEGKDEDGYKTEFLGGMKAGDFARLFKKKETIDKAKAMYEGLTIN